MSNVSQNRTVNANELRAALNVCIRKQRPVFIWGPFGAGKSEIVEQLCEESDGLLYDLRLSQMEQTDLRGMPFFNKETNQMEWAPPIDLPDAETAAKYPVVFLFLDEMNSAMPATQAAAYQLVLNRRVGTYKLPDNVVIIAAGNRESDKGVTYKMPKPLANRFVHMELRVDYDCWLDWAAKQKINPAVVGYVTAFKSALYDFDPKNPEHACATPRTWTFVSELIEDGGISEGTCMDLVAGSVGQGHALKFMAHRRFAKDLPTNEDVFRGTAEPLKIKEISAQYALITSLVFDLDGFNTDQNKPKDWKEKFHKATDNMLGYILDNMSTEIVVMGMRMALKKFNLPLEPSKLTNFKRFKDGPGQLVFRAAS